MFDSKSLSSGFLGTLFFLFSSISGPSTFAQGSGCEPVATIPHGVDEMYTDATGGLSLRGRSLVAVTDGVLRLYQFRDNGSPIFIGEQVLSISGASTHLSTDGTILSVAFNSLAPVEGSSYTSSAPLRTVERFSLTNLEPLSSFLDERVNNIAPRYECTKLGICADIYAPEYPWENWRDSYACVVDGTCMREGKLGRFFVSSEGIGTLLNNREFTPNYLLQNFPECVILGNTTNCNFSEGGMVAGGIRTVGDTLFTAPQEKWTLPPVPELVADLKRLHPCSGFGGSYHCMSEADFNFSYFTDLAVDHETKFAIVGMKVGIQPGHIADMEDVGMVSLMKLGANSMNHAAESAVTVPIAGQKIGFSVAAVGAAEVVDETGTLIPAFVVASGAPGNGHPSASLPSNSCTSISAAIIPPSQGGAVFISSHETLSGKLQETKMFYRKEENHKFGYDVAAATDLNGDSQPEVIAGAPGGEYAMVFSGNEGDLNLAVTIEGRSTGFGKQVGVMFSESGARFFAVGSDTEIQIYDAESCYRPENFGNGGYINDWQPPSFSGCPHGGPQTEEEVQAAFDQVYDAGVEYLQSLGLGAGFEHRILDVLQPLLDLLIDRIEEQLQQLLQNGYNVSYTNRDPLEQFVFLQTLLPELQAEGVNLQKARKRWERSKKLKKKARALRKAGEWAKAKDVRKKVKRKKGKAESLVTKAIVRLRVLLEPTQ